MEFKEAYKKGLKTGKSITNGSYELKLTRRGLTSCRCNVDNNTPPPDIIGIFIRHVLKTTGKS
jgi:hypothetical protein